MSPDFGPVATLDRSDKASACEPYLDFIEVAQQGPEQRSNCQDLLDDHGFIGRYSSVNRFVYRIAAAALPCSLSSLHHRRSRA